MKLIARIALLSPLVLAGCVSPEVQHLRELSRRCAYGAHHET